MAVWVRADSGVHLGRRGGRSCGCDAVRRSQQGTDEGREGGSAHTADGGEAQPVEEGGHRRWLRRVRPAALEPLTPLSPTHSLPERDAGSGAPVEAGGGAWIHPAGAGSPHSGT
ncbi:hypothetical protein GCM10020358_26440 [Amorphoplanes nipponensis]